MKTLNFILIWLLIFSVWIVLTLLVDNSAQKQEKVINIKEVIAIDSTDIPMLKKLMKDYQQNLIDSRLYESVLNSYGDKPDDKLKIMQQECESKRKRIINYVCEKYDLPESGHVRIDVNSWKIKICKR